ncbi:uncharacterized protein STEHIDRAFT_150572 [Stereum hirsutum FP-91666 SS1]|uniref:RanBD1 domain-containing protein n=1 Tax=Stereum hirsutum (strain FP-91666) TaxID=721885 RepID=R7RYG4_STEHR|nr:uncharacterized protein STEHIDRAFT_150572 [Stereum hirsutum FP-91666 SS1]EIM80369.1 hypothetical protein STEHIDRAFT_150572 [Stereum hirsutum FP-91666 SS1]
MSEPDTPPKVDEQGSVQEDDVEQDDDLKLSRKREREISQEPATPQREEDDEEDADARAARRDRDVRSPTKKNRTNLASTAESNEEDDFVLVNDRPHDNGSDEDDEEEEEEDENIDADDGPGSTQPVSGSPPHETKMRQISQGVEDISWRQQQGARNSTESLIKVDAPTTPAAADDIEEAGEDASHDDSASAELHDHSMDGPELLSAAIPAHGSSSEENLDVHIPDAERSPQPPAMDIHPDESAPIPMPAYSTLHKPTPAPAEHVDIPEDSVDKPISQKRKLEERAASLAPTEPASPPPAPPSTLPPSIPPGEEKDADVEMPKKEDAAKSDEAPTKRPRDDADKDDNPRETKRPSPPPVPAETKPKERAKSTSSSRERAASGSSSTTTAAAAPTTTPATAKPPVSAPDSEKVTKPAPAPTPSGGGFLAYASAASPFASVKGPNLFGSSSKSPSPWSTASSSHTATNGSATTSATPPTTASASSPSAGSKRKTGFEAFVGSSSPFSSAKSSSGIDRPKSPLARSKSPGSGHGRRGSGSSVGGVFGGGGSVFGSTPGGSSVFGNSAGTGTGNNGAGGGFGAYAKGGAQGFAIPAAKRARAGSPIGNGSETSLADPETSSAKKEERERSESRNGRKSEEGSDEGVDGDEKDKDKNEESRRSESRTREGSTFGEKLRAERDSDKEIADGENEDGYVWGEGRKKGTLEEKETVTGEEDEETVHHVRGKLYFLTSDNAWKERGTGTLRVNVRRADGRGARLLMRKEAVYAVILNVPLFKGMKCFIAADPRFLRFSVIEEGKTTHYNLRVASAKAASDLLDEINANIPSGTNTPAPELESAV